MSFWRSITDWTEEHDPLFKLAKKGAYAVAKQDSDNMEGIGRRLGWDWLTEEAQRNQKNPGRAIGKAAATAATIYAGGAAGAAGAGGSAAGNAGGAAMTAADTEAALAAQQIAAQQAAQQAALQSQGLMGPQGFANTMEAGMTDTGYTPSTLLNAARFGGDSGQGLLGSAAKWAANAPGKMSASDAKMGLMGLQMMSPQQQPYQPAPPPPPAQPMPQSNFSGYSQGSDPFAGMSEEQKRKILMMLQQQGGMR